MVTIKANRMRRPARASKFDRGFHDRVAGGVGQAEAELRTEALHVVILGQDIAATVGSRISLLSSLPV